ncbi:MAG TPA: hypothetical protein DIW47_01705 [Bacteroidetes bacterium]|nr:hypothetical protein [Bacteroidota bacterium]
MINCGPSSPDRLPNIPENTFWAGKDTLGHWFMLDSINKSAGTVHFKIYNDRTGKLVSDRNFKLYCYLCEDKIDMDNLKEEISGYDEVPFNYEYYIMLKEDDDMGKTCYFK